MPLSALESMQLDEVLEHVNVPSYVIDSTGVIRWVNAAARNIVGDVQGRQFTSVVAPEETLRARELFARKVVGAERVTDAGVVLVNAAGERVALEISSVPLVRGEHVVGVFGQVSDIVEEPHQHPDLKLTPRQTEILEYLERRPLDERDRPGAAAQYRDRAQPRSPCAARCGCALPSRGGCNRQRSALVVGRRMLGKARPLRALRGRYEVLGLNLREDAVLRR